MPSSSIAQRNYIFYLRSKYKSEKNTPENQKWIWDQEWTQIEESSFLSEIKAWIDPDGNYLPFSKLMNHDRTLPSGLEYSTAMRKGWIRLYKTPKAIHITCCDFNARKLKCCMRIFSKDDNFKNSSIIVASDAKIIEYKPMFREDRFIKPYKRFFTESIILSEKEQQSCMPIIF